MSTSTAQFVLSDHESALQLSQKASDLISKSTSMRNSLPLSILAPSETPEMWTNLERTFYACLQTSDDKSAYLALQRLTQRFGANNERVMGLKGLYQEAVAREMGDLRKIIEEYNKILSENPTNGPIHKRRIAIMRSLKHDNEAIAALVDFLESFPADTEAWCELADLYQSQGLSSQAMFCLEEALLSVPYAWNLHARLGELGYMTALSTTDGADAAQRLLVQAIKRFGRSVELCDDYLRGYYGLKLATAYFLKTGFVTKNVSSDYLSKDTVQRLHDLATIKLDQIVNKRSSPQLKGIDESSIIAARELLDRTKT